MQDFLDDLEQRLAAIAAEQAPARRPRHWRRRVAGGLTAAGTVVAATFALTGTSVADLPILGTETRDASGVAERAPFASKEGVDFTAAHPFGTPAGPGYAVTNDETQTICLVLPDPTAAGEYGGACDPIPRVEQSGLLVSFPGDLGMNPRATTLFAFVLPENAEDVAVKARGRSREPQITDGVVVDEVRSAAVLSWSLNGTQRSEDIPGPFPPSTGLGITCPDGRSVNAPPLPAGTPPSEVGDALRALRKQACK